MELETYFKTRVRRIKRSNRWVRMTLGFLLVIGGFLGALPVLGFWMLPLGLILLSVDFPWAKRASAYLRLQWRRLKARYKRARRSGIR
jgi:hypothetical protein